jgi:hypothetical protein
LRSCSLRSATTWARKHFDIQLTATDVTTGIRCGPASENPAPAPSVTKPKDPSQYKNNLQLHVDFFLVLASKQCDDGE